MKPNHTKILVIDDEVGMREGIRRLFEAEGFEVETAENGIEGVEKGIALEYDLYFIDLKMPDLDGQAVLKAIKKKFPESICIIMTAYASFETAVETIRTGAYNYMPKPFTPDDLQTLADRALERRWYILENRRLRADQERRLLEVAHEQSRIRAIINTIDDGVVVVNQDGELVLFNPRFLTLFDIREEIAIGQQILDILPAALADQISQILKQLNLAIATRQEIVIHPPAKLVVMSNTTPILHQNGQVLGTVSVIRDITEIKKLEILKSQFVNMVAHELKAPLAAIQGYLDIVVNKSLGEQQETYDNYLKRSLERSNSLIELISDLLNISRIEAGKVRHEIELLNIGKLLGDTAEFFIPESRKNNITVELQLEEDLYIEADNEEIQRMIINLLSNAIKYNKENGHIYISGSRSGHFVKISVRDTGIGMKPGEKERLFEEFFRAKNKYTRLVTGTGLGLSIVKKITDSYAGKMEVESEFEKGSTFTIYLPAAKNVKTTG